MHTASGDVPPPAGQRLRPIVAIGASAVGVPALQRFLLAVEPDCGSAFVIVPHREADPERHLSLILNRSCALSVVQAQDGMECEPNHVYVIPPDAKVTVDAGRLRFSGSDNGGAVCAPIDAFFLSLAEDQEENAGCVILSGTRSDGVLGVRAVKAHGGVAFALCDGEPGQPNAASQAAEFADIIMLADEVPARLRRHFAHLHALADSERLGRMREDIAAHLPDICDILRVRTGYDFSGYKASIAVRRIQRRMHVLQIPDAGGFLARLKSEPREADLLFQDLLVSVTRFFSDRAALAALAEEVVPQVVKGKDAGYTLRVWVPGCATGEEAYAAAILLSEHVRDEQGPQIQIFASDIDERALRVARCGRYPESIAQAFTPERLSRFFVQEDGSYRVAAGIRDKCLFTKHDLLRDPPFSRVDLVVCRNVLVHLETALQNRIVSLLHYALRDGGYLLMGESENVSDAELFEPVARAHRIFRKRPKATKRPDFPISPRAPAQRPVAVQSPAASSSIQERAEQQVLERYAPAHVIMDASGEIFYTSGRTGHYFEMAQGAPRNNAFDLARPGLREELRTAFTSAADRQQAVIARNITFEADGALRTIDLIVQPLDRIDTPDATYMLLFREIGNAFGSDWHEVERVRDDGSVQIRQLELDLQFTRELLQTTSEELESSNEELRSANEELSSLNEELNSVNSELTVRVDELNAALSDMANLLESTGIATIILDRKFRLRFFTPAARDFYHLVTGDLGRPVSDLRPRFDADSLQSDAAGVMNNLGTVEREVASNENGSRYLLKILPYKTADGAIEGVVMTFAAAG
jgi:two-component system, chemotaxis family, CheB/CheR fusion protein